MTTSEQELRTAFSAAMAMPDGAAQHAALDAAIRAADAAGQDRLAFEFRDDAIEKYVFGGDDRRAFLAFSLSLAAYDRDPEIGGPGTEHSLLWQFKWIVNALPDFPDIPLDRTYRVLDDMRARYLRGGHSLHPVHQARWQIALHVGDFDQAAASYHDMVTAKRDSLSNCSVCVPTAQADYLNTLGRHTDAIAVAAPHQNSWCRTQPARVRTSLMTAYLHTGKHRRALELHRLAYRTIRTERLHLASLAVHIEFLARTGNETRALELVERHLPWLEAPVSPADTLSFLGPAVLVLRRLGEAGHGAATVQGPTGPDGRRAVVTVDVLRERLQAQAEELAARFDARNGNTYQSELLRQRISAEPVLAKLALSVLDTVGRRTRPLIAQAQARVAEHTAAGDVAAAALARLDAAYLLREHNDREIRLTAAEEAALAVERAGLPEALLRARELLWDLYRGAGQRDDALAVLDLLLAEPSVPTSRRAELLDQAALLFWGEPRAERREQAAALHREAGDRLAELSSLQDAVVCLSGAAPERAVALLERADARLADPPAGIDTDAWESMGGRLHLTAARLHDDRDDELALARAEQAMGCRDDAVRVEAAVFTARHLLRRDRPAEAERLACDVVGDADRANAYRLHVVRATALRALGREEEQAAVMAEHDIETWELDYGADDDDYEDEDDD
ncbi:hypothetical protein ACFQY4_24885 [Catellatospora bangladeshensis]|uniref:Tetratricopeptide repeat protein n=1 Tax=Catellatospora bangladeshensis TaxID=310355 RepID=A0A8J3NKF9_9ACTN|nr:hypothetical protein [Catellatospora bangladeshensis]GIF81485.1 hypothetical protein Cba03nite_28340 [Catellatospora bangladeshensis]